MQEQYEFMIEALVDKGFASVDHFFDAEEIKGLRQSLESHYQNDDFRLAGIGNKDQLLKVEEIRNDRIMWLDPQSNQPFEEIFLSKVNAFVDYLNKTCFAGIQENEFHYAVYPPGSFYHRHVDRFENDDSRQFSMVCYLSHNWEPKDGGRLLMYTDDEDTISIEPIPGRLVFFRSDIPHEVEVSHQYRYSITGWLKRNSLLPI